MDETYYLRLKDPCYVSNNKWEACWWDESHMSFILLLQNTFYLWGPGLLNYSNSGTNNDRSAVSRLYQSPGKVHGSDLNLAKVSLDFDLLALQIEDTVEVIDMKSNEAWSIKIKSGHDNCILENGIIWSDHGGDSQDMIIITLRGLEIYKISTKRNQCKLSRSISQGYSITANFWYEPNFRTILLAAPLYYPGDKETMNGTYANTATHLFKSLLGGYPSKVEQASVGMERMGDIVLNGYFLKIDKDNFIPKMELPPPDKTPSLDIGSGCTKEDISLVTLYGHLYIMIHKWNIQAIQEAYNYPGVMLFRCEKNAIMHTHTLMTATISHHVRYSTYDNLVMMHSVDHAVSLLFDIKDVRKREGLRLVNINKQKQNAIQEVTSGNIDKVELLDMEPYAVRVYPVVLATPLAIDDGEGPVKSFHGLENGRVGGGDHGGNGGSCRNSADREELSDIVKERSASLDITNSVDINRSDSTDNGTSHVANGNNDMNHNPSHSSNSDARPHLNSVDELLSKSKEYASISHEEHLSNHKQSHLSSGDFLYKDIGKPASQRTWRFLYPCWMWSSQDNCLWKVCICFANIVTSIENSRQALGFAMRRGQLSNLPSQRYNLSLHTREDAMQAKILILHLIGYNLEMQLSIPNLEVLYHAVSLPYVNEHQRLSTQKEERYRSQSNIGQLIKSNLVSPSKNGSSSSLEQNGEKGDGETATDSGSDEGKEKKQGPSDPEGTGDNANKGDANVDDSTTGELVVSLPESDTSENPSYISDILNVASNYAANMINEAQDALISLAEEIWPTEDGIDEPLEPSAAVHILHKDIYSINADTISNFRRASLYSKRVTSRDSLHSNQSHESNDDKSIDKKAFEYAPMVDISSTAIPLGEPRRDKYGNLVITQTELISHVWIPLILVNRRGIDVEYASHALALYIAVVRGTGIDSHHALSMLLLRLLCAQGRYMEISRLIQLNFFPDSTEAAMTALEIADIIVSLPHKNKSNRNSPTGKQDHSNTEMNYLRFCQSRNGVDHTNGLAVAIRTLQQVGLDILWRLKQSTVIVRWLLGHGEVMHAIDLINAAKIKRSNADDNTHGEDRHQGSGNSGDASNVSSRNSSPTNKGKGKGLEKSSSSDNILNSNTGLVADVDGVDFFNGAVIALKSIAKNSVNSNGDESTASTTRRSANVYQQQINLLHNVYLFIQKWDAASITPIKEKGNDNSESKLKVHRSRIAAQSVFPDTFKEQEEQTFKQLFGYLKEG